MFEFIAQQSAGIAAQIVTQTPEFTPAEQVLADRYPGIAAASPEIIRQLANVNDDIRTGPTHPEIWMPGNRLSYFLATGAVSHKM